MELTPAACGPVSCSFTVRLSAGGTKVFFLSACIAEPSNESIHVTHHLNPGRGRECGLPSLQPGSFMQMKKVRLEQTKDYEKSIFFSLPVCRSSRDATSRCGYQHCIPLLSQPNPLLHQPSFPLHVLLRLFWVRAVRERNVLISNADHVLSTVNTLTMFVNDFLDLLIKILAAFDKGV